MMGEIPTGVVTFLFTDVVGSTRLWAEHHDAMLLGVDHQPAQRMFIDRICPGQRQARSVSSAAPCLTGEAHQPVR